jgi:hypothetical protein
MSTPRRPAPRSRAAPRMATRSGTPLDLGRPFPITVHLLESERVQHDADEYCCRENDQPDTRPDRPAQSDSHEQEGHPDVEERRADATHHAGAEKPEWVVVGREQQVSLPDPPSRPRRPRVELERGPIPAPHALSLAQRSSETTRLSAASARSWARFASRSALSAAFRAAAASFLASATAFRLRFF